MVPKDHLSHVADEPMTPTCKPCDENVQAEEEFVALAPSFHLCGQGCSRSEHVPAVSSHSFLNGSNDIPNKCCETRARVSRVPSCLSALQELDGASTTLSLERVPDG